MEHTSRETTVMEANQRWSGGAASDVASVVLKLSRLCAAVSLIGRPVCRRAGLEKIYAGDRKPVEEGARLDDQWRRFEC